MLEALSMVKTFRVTAGQWAYYETIMRRGGIKTFSDLVSAGLKRICKEIESRESQDWSFFDTMPIDPQKINDTPAELEQLPADVGLVEADQVEVKPAKKPAAKKKPAKKPAVKKKPAKKPAAKK